MWPQMKTTREERSPLLQLAKVIDLRVKTPLGVRCKLTCTLNYNIAKKPAIFYSSPFTGRFNKQYESIILDIDIHHQNKNNR